jgi:hypothetical protein
MVSASPAPAGARSNRTRAVLVTGSRSVAPSPERSTVDSLRTSYTTRPGAWAKPQLAGAAAGVGVAVFGAGAAAGGAPLGPLAHAVTSASAQTATVPRRATESVLEERKDV